MERNIELYNAIENENIQAIEKMIKDGIDINSIDEKEGTALSFASGRGIVNIVQFLIDNGANVNLKDDTSHSALAIASNNNQIEVMKILLDNGANIDDNHYPRNRQLDPYNFVHQDIKEPISSGNALYALCNGYGKNRFEAVKLLLDRGANTEVKDSCFGNTPLLCISSTLEASSTGGNELIKLLLDRGANIEAKNKKGYTALLEASSRRDGKMIKLLLEKGANIEAKGEDAKTALLALFDVNRDKYITVHVSTHSSRSIFKILLEKGANIEAQTNDGSRALHLACSSKNIKLIEFILDSGADINAKTNEGFTALDVACSLKDEEMIELLLDRCANIESIDNSGKTALLTACEKNNREIVTLLLDRGANIEAQIKENLNLSHKVGMTALMIATSQINAKMVILLLDKGANVDTKRVNFSSGETALDIACLQETSKMSNLIDGYDKNKHNPQKLVNILTNFTIDTPIKYTTHEWRNRVDAKYFNDFDLFLEDVSEQFKTLGNELKTLSPNLYQKVETFIVSTENPNSWKSMKDLKLWVEDKKEPFDFPIANEHILFKTIIESFKNEIEIRGNRLQEIFLEHKKRLGRKFKITISDNLKGEKFYTDVEIFKNAVDEIFREIEKYANEQNEYEVEVQLFKPENNFIELHIIHVGSTSTRQAIELLDRIKQEKGDSVLRGYFENLCDWEIKASHKNNHFTIDCFHEEIKNIEKAKGFTHSIRFYK